MVMISDSSGSSEDDELLIPMPSELVCTERSGCKRKRLVVNGSLERKDPWGPPEMRGRGRQCDYSQAQRNGTSIKNIYLFFFFLKAEPSRQSVNHCKTSLRHLRGFGRKKFREGGAIRLIFIVVVAGAVLLVRLLVQLIKEVTDVRKL